jgi:hypothetical protein
MKNQISILSLVLITTFSLSASSCSSSSEKSASAAQAIIDTPDYSDVIKSYLSLKDALVASDAAKASSASTQLSAALATIEGDLSAKIKADAKLISESADKAVQRAYFKTLSDNVYELIKISKDKKTVLYRQYCPMANDNQGAYWLSDSKEIMNPYFGNMMLRCGSVKETL